MSVSPAEHYRIVWRYLINKFFRRPFFIEEHLMLPVSSSDKFPWFGPGNLFLNLLGNKRRISCIAKFDKIGIKRTKMYMSIIESWNHQPAVGINDYCGAFFYKS